MIVVATSGANGCSTASSRTARSCASCEEPARGRPGRENYARPRSAAPASDARLRDGGSRSTRRRSTTRPSPRCAAWLHDDALGHRCDRGVLAMSTASRTSRACARTRVLPDGGVPKLERAEAAGALPRAGAAAGRPSAGRRADEDTTARRRLRRARACRTTLSAVRVADRAGESASAASELGCVQFEQALHMCCTCSFRRLA